ncbi:hypothetical protein D8I35_03125 [Corticibacter populi]|uniref:DUF7660 domain-containing protein n=1 Tax=Corticibacter populi TaxID=1550736 RepID=A0A3M6R023_9BURK|nr:hypothetical protein D8I35_03120 [Corticibacter populi]RMX08132.1 hypothetical protein D8I35_03125 [Corticibacter populi]RZS35384.1 hypothetical protein EV687_0448 [Corticibacter populi]RZS35385.1 hypothetical protein EV687_0449 [Corticibacter populi]
MEQDRLFNSLNSVSDESSFVHFVKLLVADRQSADRFPLTIDGFRGDWANHTITDFLEAAVSWAEDSDFGERPGPKPSNPWYLFALFLWAGQGYE